MHGFPGTDTIVEEDGHIGHAAVLHGCVVKRNALVGMNAVVNDNAVVGESAIVAAMAFVKAGFVVPPRTLVAGVPARIVRELTEQEMAWKVEGTRSYQELTRRSLATMTATSPLPAPETGSQAARARRTAAAVGTESRNERLEAHRVAVAAGVRRGDVAVVRLDDELAGAKIHVGVGHRFHLVAERDQASAQFGRRGCLEVE